MPTGHMKQKYPDCRFPLSENTVSTRFPAVCPAAAKTGKQKKPFHRRNPFCRKNRQASSVTHECWAAPDLCTGFSTGFVNNSTVLVSRLKSVRLCTLPVGEAETLPTVQATIRFCIHMQTARHSRKALSMFPAIPGICHRSFRAADHCVQMRFCLL